MKYEYLTNTPLDKAVKTILSALEKAGTKSKTEKIDVRHSLGRVSACAAYAKRCSPHYCASAMDGIAIKAQISFGASDASPVTLGSSDYIRVDTGDELPQGCDSVVMIENVVEHDDGRISLYSAAVPWQNVRQIGEDICMGDMIMPSFTKITPSIIGALLAGGVFSLEVIKKPVFAIIPTGDEIVSAQQELFDSDIPEFNSAIFSAMLEEWGALSKIYPIVPDNPGCIEAAIKKAALECDGIIVIAGSSAGREDYTSSALKNVGTLILHGIAIKPGKPAILGHVGSVPFIGLPGYPVSGIIVMEEIVRHIVGILTCLPCEKPPVVQARVSRRINSSLKYREYIRTRLGVVDNTTVAVPMERGAGIVSGFSKASGIITVSQDSEGIEAGESVQVKLIKPLSEIESSVCAIGSHDPLIDEIADLLKRKDIRMNVVSGHVGSMGGIMAVLRKEAHLCGIHLLDETDGVYNISYVKKYFPHGGVVLVKGVGRLQGLMVRRGNPLNITGLKDIALKRLSYVNRQKGSGTRILLDYLLKANGISYEDICGYFREEYTHTGVAAIISKGGADAGLGIYSAAKIYGLDFIPLWNEEYDFLVSESAFKQENVRRFLEVLRSKELKDRLERMGGYTFADIGAIKNLEA
jgi:putative molybdopterin biosynthesis protein